MENNYSFDLSQTFNEVRREIERAKQLHGNQNFNSRHEAYGVILEEVDELWTEIKKNTKTFDPLICRKEAVQVMAMVARLCVELL